ncbi:DsbA family oxidoreductase [Nonomuraea aridisoli]|uniref:Disulfide bond formation protein DsbA n=1 Tax=Nonomuraea aridisoli TaxID=2070368 RepID=A0A2W2DRV8_9ACTN|nr:DsbA family oxidoreductase [Nonomuraea aridisoli]PZG13313.1 disulfide bond formation protein DsbA [Nonomuraea aridisoli]
MKVEIFSDVVCPWCYIGHTRFARAAERFRAKGGTIEVTMRPFQLDPSAPEKAEPIIPAMERKFGPNARQMIDRVVGVAEADGLEMDYASALSANTLEAHRLIEVATRQGLGKEMAERLFRAYFAEGRDVADREVLAELAAEVGVQDTGEGAEAVREQIDRARALGISGVPLFLFEGKYAVSGAQPEDTFAAAIDEVAERTGQTPIVQLAASLDNRADGCDDGICAV